MPSGDHADLAAMGFDFSDTPRPGPFLFPRYRGGSEAAAACVEMHVHPSFFPPKRCTLHPAHPRERVPDATGEVMVCPVQGFLQAVIFVNPEIFPF